MSSDATALSAGTLVRVRQRTYLVEDVATAPGASAVVRLACVDDDAQGRRLEVIWDVEVDARVLPAGRTALRPGAAPDDPRTFAAYLHALRWGCVTSTDPTLFQAPLRAGIVPKSYQLEPLRKALAMPRVSLFVADDVGLGKTIEAGLVLQELVLRQRVSRAVVACPASVLLQWREELRQRFGLDFVVLDKAYVDAQRRERGFGVNAWTTHRFFLISHALLRDEAYLGGLRELLGPFCPGSLFLLDEAHVAAPASQSRYAVDTQITRAVRDVARRFEHRLFLSATPHNGHSSSFSALLEILDPQRFTRGVPVAPATLRPVLVRRLKGELKKHLGAQIPERETIQIDLGDLPEDAPELALAAALAEYGELLDRRLSAGPGRAKAAARLVLVALQKRLLSSVEAFARTLAVHRRHAGGAAGAASAAAAPGREDAPPDAAMTLEDEDLAEEDAVAIEEVEIARATRAGGHAEDDARARALLEAMGAVAEVSRHRPDAKVRFLIDWIRNHQCPDACWSTRRVIVFTEYADSKRYLVDRLAAAIGGTDRAAERILTLHGGMDEEAREQVKQAFNDPAHPARILIATDAAREGVNLQACCADLFHFDLPWNPGRLEQRNGRIDRTLQPEPLVRCHYFVYTQRPEDAVLEALVRKTARIHRDLGSLADVLERRLARLLEAGIARSRATQLARAIEAADVEAAAERASAVRDELEAARERALAAQLEALQRLHDKAASHLDLRPERLRDVVSLGLSLAGAPPLAPRERPPGSYDVPDLDALAAADPTFRDVADALRPPRTRRMPAFAWRAKHPPRPVSFEPATTLASETVQLHLQHPLAQRALAELRAQAFGEDRLARVAVAADPTHPRPRVLALGRLSLYGAGAARLHEEILAAAAIWSDGDDPARLQPFQTADAEERAVEALGRVLSREDPPAVPEAVIRRLVASAARDEEALWAAIQARAERRARWAEEKLAERARHEANEMRRVLEAQKAAIEKELARRADGVQLVLPWLPDEKAQQEQYEADTRHLDKRRVEIDGELAAEPRRVAALYDVKHRRLERVGLVYLWPPAS